MAFVIYPKDGGIGATAVCSHVAAKVAARISIDSRSGEEKGSSEEKEPG
jgi:hypothetical protein